MCSHSRSIPSGKFLKCCCMKLQGLVKVGAAMLFCLSNQQALAQQLKLGTNPSLIKSSALLELESRKQALLISRIADTAQIVNPVNGMIIYLEADNSFRVRANNYWTKLIPEGGAIKSINNDLSVAQTIKATYTPTGTFGFSTTAGTHNLVIPDAGTTAAGFVNTGTQTFLGQKTFSTGLEALKIRVTSDVGTPVALLGKNAAGDIAAIGLNTNNTLSLAAGILGANNGSALWNAGQIQGKNILTTAPDEGDLLTFIGGNWMPKAASSTAGVTTINALTAANQLLRPLYNAGTTSYGFTSTAAAHTLTIADASATIGGLVNIIPQTFKGAKTFSDGIVTGTLRINTDAGNPATKILGKDANGDVSSLTIDATLTINATTKQLGANNATNIWNANKIQNKAVSTTAPNDGQLLKWNNASSMYVPADDITGGASYGDLADGDILKATAVDPTYRMKIWKSPFAKVVNGPNTGPTGAFAWSTLTFQNTTGSNEFTTQLYFDKNTLALKEWKGVDPLVENGNPWYKVVTTLGSNIFTVGGVMFANQSVDATSEVTQDATNFFWDNTSKELGLKTNSPNATLHVNGSVATNIRTITNNTYTVLNDDYTVVLTGSGTITVTIPAADISNKGRIYVIKKGATGTSTFRIISSSAIETTAANNYLSSTTAGIKWVLQSDGIKWWIIN